MVRVATLTQLFFEKFMKVPVLSAILISSWWRSGFLCCWRVVAHSECARATPRRGQPPSRRPPKLITQERAKHQASLKRTSEAGARSRSEQATSEPLKGNQNSPRDKPSSASFQSAPITGL
jgi:hypothetical protein